MPKRRRGPVAKPIGKKRKTPVPAGDHYVIECKRDVTVVEYDADKLGYLFDDYLEKIDRRYGYDEEGGSEIEEYKEEVESYAKEGKKVGTWTATDPSGAILIFKSLENANKRAAEVWKGMQKDEKNDPDSCCRGSAYPDDRDTDPEDSNDVGPASFLKLTASGEAAYARIRTFYCDPEENEPRYVNKCVCSTSCKVVPGAVLAG